MRLTLVRIYETLEHVKMEAQRRGNNVSGRQILSEAQIVELFPFPVRALSPSLQTLITSHEALREEMEGWRVQAGINATIANSLILRLREQIETLTKERDKARRDGELEALHARRVEADRVGNSDTNGAHRMTVQRQRTGR